MAYGGLLAGFDPLPEESFEMRVPWPTTIPAGSPYPVVHITGTTVESGRMHSRCLGPMKSHSNPG